MIKRPKSNESLGDSSIPAEIMKADGEQLHRKLTESINWVWKKEKMTEQEPVTKRRQNVLRELQWYYAAYVQKVFARAVGKRLSSLSWMYENISTVDQIFTKKNV